MDQTVDDKIEKNMGLVLTIVNKFRPRTEEEKEAYIQAGRIGLWKAIGKYSPTGGSKFSPYAWNPIRWEIIKEIRSIKGKGDIVFNPLDEITHPPDPQDPDNCFWELLPKTLTEPEKEVIALRRDGFNFKEISAHLKRHRSYIKKLFDSAIFKIRDKNKHE